LFLLSETAGNPSACEKTRLGSHGQHHENPKDEQRKRLIQKQINTGHGEIFG
jgi:hypothetical protein